VPPTISGEHIAGVSQNDVNIGFGVDWHGTPGSCQLVVQGVLTQPGSCDAISAAGRLRAGTPYVAWITATNQYGESTESQHLGFSTPWYRVTTDTYDVPVNDAPRSQATPTYTPKNPSNNYGYVGTGYGFDVECQVRGGGYYKNGYTAAGGYAYYWVKVKNYNGHPDGYVPAYFTSEGKGPEGSVPGIPTC
jgi:hypothetical protein